MQARNDCALHLKECASQTKTILEVVKSKSTVLFCGLEKKERLLKIAVSDAKHQGEDSKNGYNVCICTTLCSRDFLPAARAMH
jgi:hypothetical protein